MKVLWVRLPKGRPGVISISLYSWKVSKEDEKEDENSSLIGIKENSGIILLGLKPFFTQSFKFWLILLEISKVQPELVREYFCGCIPKWWGKGNYLTSKFIIPHNLAWEYECYENFQNEAVRFNPKSEDHERILKKLWSIWFPDEAPSQNLKSQRWVDIGFQQEDARSDIRGSGIIGLNSLYYFIKHFKNDYNAMLSRKTDLFFLWVIWMNLSFMLQNYFHFRKGNVERKFENLKASATQFKNFMRVFAADKNADSLSESKQSFYILHSHLFMTFEKIWHFKIK